MEGEMLPRVIVLADGKTHENHLDDRHLTNINGKQLLVRTVQQFSEFANVSVLTRSDRLRNAVKGQRRVSFTTAGDESDRYHGIDMIRKGLEAAWSSRSIIVFGDVVFTDKAVEIIRTTEVDHWAVYGRSTDSKIVGTPWAEYFAIEVDWLGRERGKQAVNDVASQYLGGQWPHCTAWEWYYNMEKMPYTGRRNPQAVLTGPHWVEINDATDDIDFVFDIENLRRAHA